MRVFYMDIDTLRPDHLGCYGYCRDTSPNIDRVASEGVRFENVYVSDAPCLPSRASLFTGRFGIHTGVVGHGGTAGDIRIEGREREFSTVASRNSWMSAMRQAGFYTVSVSPFAERHSAWWFCDGFREMYNPGKRGVEIASEVTPYALDWLRKHGKEDNWFLHVNFWDPHTGYRTPADFGKPFDGCPYDDWLTDEMISRHWSGYGPASAHAPDRVSADRRADCDAPRVDRSGPGLATRFHVQRRHVRRTRQAATRHSSARGRRSGQPH